MSIVLQESIHIPLISDLESFRRWARSDDFPEHGWYSHLNGELWVDLSMERVIHNLIKTQIAAVLALLVQGSRSGRFFGDRMLLTNVAAALSTEPDGMFITHESLQSGIVRLEQGLESLEVEGSPDMTLEVISKTSVKKDTEVLRELYWRAGVREYWLADSRQTRPTLDILRYTARGFVSARKQAGWVKSVVFGKSFRLTQGQDVLGEPEFILRAR
jgi:Uma2 family endonuclease